MFKSKKPGLAIVELIMVLAISAGLFTIVLGTFSFRKRAQVDDSAKQVLSEISRVRNEAIQGKGPTTDQGAVNVAGGEIFGEALEFAPEQPKMVVYKLMKKDGVIKAYENYEIKTGSNLSWYIEPDNTCAPDTYTTTYASCYTKISGTSDTLGSDPIALDSPQVSNKRLMIVILNGSGQTYAFSHSYNSLDMTSMGPDASLPSSYSKPRQGKLRVAFVQPGTGTTICFKGCFTPFKTQVDSALYKYYAIFDLSVPNNQSLQVVK